MRIPFRIRLFLAAMAALLAALAAADHYLSEQVRGLTMAQTRDEQSSRFRILARGLPPPEAITDATCEQIAGDVGASARVRLVTRNGRTLAHAGSLEPEPRWPDDAEALADAFAAPGSTITRVDDLRPTPLLHLAIALPISAQSGGAQTALHVLRPLPEADRALIATQRQIGRGLLLALLIVVGLTWGGPLLVAREVRHVTEAARRMSQGDLTVRAQLEPNDPYAPLGQALDKLAENLSRTVSRLRDESDLLSRILEGMEEGVLVLDDDRRVILLNRALSSMLLVDPRTAGRAMALAPGAQSPSPLDVKGKSLIEITMNPDLELLLDRTVAQPPRASGETDVGDLKPRRLLVRATRLSGAPWGFLLVFVDVTEVRRLESLRRDFVANVSHELRTPVAAVRSAAETLRSAAERDPVAAERFLGIIERNAERLQVLVEDLLDLSRIESREYRLAIEPLEASRVVADVLALFRDRAEARRVHLRTQIAPDLAPLHTDRRALEQVLVNLVDNAVKYVPEDATITVSAESHGDKIRFFVADTGVGIAERHLPRLFERFYRVDPGRSRDRGGSGLGLAIVKHLVDAMGGVVAVESAAGKGTIFRVELPWQRTPPAAPADVHSPSPPDLPPPGAGPAQPEDEGGKRLLP